MELLKRRSFKNWYVPSLTVFILTCRLIFIISNPCFAKGKSDSTIDFKTLYADSLTEILSFTIKDLIRFNPCSAKDGLDFVISNKSL